MSKLYFIILALMLALGIAYAADNTPKIVRFGMNDLVAPVSVSTAPNGDLVVLDKPGASYRIVRLTTEGKMITQVDVPADVTTADLVNVDSNGVYYITGWRAMVLWMFQPGNAIKGVTLKIRPVGMDLQRVDGQEYLYISGDKQADGVNRYNLTDGSLTVIPLSAYPAKGGLGSLHVRSNGDIYAYSNDEGIVWHFDASGKFIDKFGGGGPRPPRRGLPAEYMGPTYTVDTNGDIYWTLGDYGSLDMITADGNTAVQYNGKENWSTNWVGPIHTVRGIAISGDKVFALDAPNKGRLIAFPKSVVAPNAPDCDTVNAKLFGLTCRVEADKPYKLFTEPTANLRLVFDAGNRRLHQLKLSYTLYDIWHKEIAKDILDFELPGNDGATINLPVLNLPKLGWYELDLAVMEGDQLLLERICFLSRTDIDPNNPIPEKEVSGWNDLETHLMVGMGLHRFALGSNLKQLEDAGVKAQLEFIKKNKIPYFIQITDKGVCTPESVRYVLTQCPDLPILEIMNEPDMQGVSPQNYVPILKACYEEAKRINPRIIVLGPTKCGVELGWMEAFFKAGGGNYVDAVSVHTYERHNSMDANHWQWKFAALRDLMTKYGCGNKPIYQTEHGFLGDYHGIILQHRWQGHSMYLEDFMLDRAGVGIDKNSYFYLNSGGFADFSSYLVDGRRELLPAATLMRTRAHFLNGKRFANVINFGKPANMLVLGNIYTGQNADVLVLVNSGLLKPIDVAVMVPAGAKFYDCFGNPFTPELKNGSARFGVEMYPSYVVVPHGAKIQAIAQPFGKDITAEAKVLVDDPGAVHVDYLTNGVLEYDFHDEPIREPFMATDKKLPVSITLEFPKSHKFSQTVLFGMMADNGFCSPLEYDVYVRTKGEWKKVDEVRIPADGRTVKYDPLVKMLAWYDNPWVFLHNFTTPVEGDAVAFTFLRMTQGQHVNQEINFRNITQRVMAREIQVFANE